MKQDIKTEQDIENWQNAFYSKLLADPITAPKFAHLDLPIHLPSIVDFWAFVFFHAFALIWVLLFQIQFLKFLLLQKLFL